MFTFSKQVGFAFRSFPRTTHQAILHPELATGGFDLPLDELPLGVAHRVIEQYPLEEHPPVVLQPDAAVPEHHHAPPPRLAVVLLGRLRDEVDDAAPQAVQELRERRDDPGGVRAADEQPGLALRLLRRGAAAGRHELGHVLRPRERSGDHYRIFIARCRAYALASP